MLFEPLVHAGAGSIPSNGGCMHKGGLKMKTTVFKANFQTENAFWGGRALMTIQRHSLHCGIHWPFVIHKITHTQAYQINVNTSDV